MLPSENRQGLGRTSPGGGVSNNGAPPLLSPYSSPPHHHHQTPLPALPISVINLAWLLLQEVPKCDCIPLVGSYVYFPKVPVPGQGVELGIPHRSIYLPDHPRKYSFHAPGRGRLLATASSLKHAKRTSMAAGAQLHSVSAQNNLAPEHGCSPVAWACLLVGSQWTLARGHRCPGTQVPGPQVLGPGLLWAQASGIAIQFQPVFAEHRGHLVKERHPC